MTGMTFGKASWTPIWNQPGFGFKVPSLPLPGVGAIGNVGKIALAAGAVGGVSLASYLFGGKSQAVTQQADLKSGGYNFNQVPNGGPQNVTLTNPTTGSNTSSQQATQTQTDFGGLTMIIGLAVVAGVALMVMKK